MHPPFAKYSMPFVVLAFVAVALIYDYSQKHMNGSIRYQGEYFPYSDYDEFQEDRVHFNPTESKRIQELLESATSPETCRTDEELARFMFKLKVPGYSLGGGNRSTSRGDVSFNSIEIPNAGKERVLVYLHSTEKNAYIRIDDFIADAGFSMPIPEIKIDGNTIKYIRPVDGSLIRESDFPESLVKCHITNR